jgi:hypothetical protein
MQPEQPAIPAHPHGRERIPPGGTKPVARKPATRLRKSRQAQPGRLKAGSSARDAPSETGRKGGRHRSHSRRHDGRRAAQRALFAALPARKGIDRIGDSFELCCELPRFVQSESTVCARSRSICTRSSNPRTAPPVTSATQGSCFKSLAVKAANSKMAFMFNFPI